MDEAITAHSHDSRLCGTVASIAGAAGTGAVDAPASVLRRGTPIIEWHRRATLDTADLAEWAALAERSAPPNVFAQPWLVLAGLAHCDPDGLASIAFVRSAAGRLIAVIPLVAAPRIGRMPLPVVSNWTHSNSFLNPCLIEAGADQACWAALIPALSAQFPAARALLLTDLAAADAPYAGLCTAARTIGLPVEIEACFDRAMLQTASSPEDYWDAAVRPKKRKELRRQWARLAELGDLETAKLAHDADVGPWIEEFLTLESTGWKGANGSALASHASTAAFFRSALRAAHSRGQLAITAMRLDGQAIAMLVQFISGDAGFSFKTAFDERYARFSPGVLLQRESLSLLHERTLAWIDSCAAADHPMIDSLWRERRRIVSVSMPLPGRSNHLLFSLAQAAKHGWHRLKGIAR